MQPVTTCRANSPSHETKTWQTEGPKDSYGIGNAIVEFSTSANIDGFTPMKDERSVAMTFPNQIDTIVSGELGGRTRPSEIRHVLTGDVIRQG